MSLGSDIGQVDSGIFNELLVTPHFADISLAPVRVAPKEGGLAFDEKTQMLYYSRNYRWIPITPGGGPIVTPPGLVVQTTSPTGSTFTAVTIVSASPEIVVTNGNGVGGNPTLTFVPGAVPLPVLPQGIIAEQTGPSGNTFTGVTIMSSTAAITVSNGNGVGGNPTLTFNPATAGITAANVSVLPAGLLVGPTLQDDINYLGLIYNATNGFSAHYTPPQLVTAGTTVQPVGPWSVLVNPPSFYTGTTFTLAGTFTPPVNGRYNCLASIDFTGSIGGGFVSLTLRTTPGNVVLLGNTPNDYAGFVIIAQDIALSAGVTYQLAFQNLTTNDITLNAGGWSMRLLQV
jgi:hypothetical protein